MAYSARALLTLAVLIFLEERVVAPLACEGHGMALTGSLTEGERNALVVQGGEGAHLPLPGITVPWPPQAHSEASIYFQTEKEDAFRESFQKRH